MKIFTLFFLFLLFCSIDASPQPVVSDIDGNTYPVITIGAQEWLRENLRTTRYRNGEYIPDCNAAADEEGMGCSLLYNNSAENGPIYGRLYNWYAVTHTAGLCPEGWRLPTNEDWQQLIDFTDADAWGNNNIAGRLLKSRRQADSPLGVPWSTNNHPRWNAHEIRHGIDEYGFGALPAGGWSASNGFLNLGSYAYFWSTTAASDALALARIFNYSHRGVSRASYEKGHAFSVRCLRVAEPQMYSLTLTLDPLASGTMTGAGNYPLGQQITITAAPADGYIFEGWYDENNDLVSTLQTDLFTMPAMNVTLRALFSEIPVSVVIREFPWLESFEQSNFPPAGWESVNVSGPLREWRLNSNQNITQNGSRSAVHEYGPSSDGPQEGWLILPPVELPEGQSLQLSFWSFNAWPDWYFRNSVRISTQSADPASGTFTQVWQAASVSQEWVRTVINLGGYAGQTIYIAFVYQGTDAHSWHLDDVGIRQP